MINEKFELCQLAADLSEGRLTSVALTEECFRRIGQDPCADPFVYLDFDGAMEAAQASDARRKNGTCIGPLDGIPFAAEDRFCVKGIPTENHCGMLRGYKPPYNAHAIERLQAEGAVFLGKLRTDGFLSGRTENKLRAERLVGANGIVPFALMAETGGSLLCLGRDGVAAFSCRALSRFGMIACAPSFDSVGVLAGSVRSCKIVADLLTNRCDQASPEKRRSTPRIATWGQSFDEKTLNAGWPDFTALSKAYRILSSAETASEMAMYDGIRFGVVEEQGKTAREQTAAVRGRCFSAEEHQLILLGTALLMGERRAECYSAARGLREAVLQALRALYSEYDLLACPLTDRALLLSSLGGLSAISASGMLWMTPQGREAVLWETAESALAEGSVN